MKTANLGLTARIPFAPLAKPRFVYFVCLFVFVFPINENFSQKTFHGGPSVFKSQKNRQGKPTKGFC